MDAVSLLVVGRDGHGKRSTCNSIFGEKHFSPSSTILSAEFDCTVLSLPVNERDVTLTKISGVDYPSPDVTGCEKCFEKIEEVVKARENGFSAVIIVLKYGLRYTKQEQDYITMIKSIFGSDVVKNYGVIVLTNGDNFAADNEENGQTFEDWCQAQTGEFRAVLEECGGRCVLFNNWEKDKEKLNKQRDELFSEAANIPLKMNPYTFADYEKAASSRTSILVTCALPKLQKETTEFLTEVGTKMRQLKEIKSQEEAIKGFETLQKTLQERRLYLENQDKNTQILKSLFLEMSLTEKAVDVKLQIASKRAQLAMEEWEVVVNDPEASTEQNVSDQENSSSNPKAPSADQSGTVVLCSGSSDNSGAHALDAVMPEKEDMDKKERDTTGISSYFKNFSWENFYNKLPNWLIQILRPTNLENQSPKQRQLPDVSKPLPDVSKPLPDVSKPL